jgi:hypothetical protein
MIFRVLLFIALLAGMPETAVTSDSYDERGTFDAIRIIAAHDRVDAFSTDGMTRGFVLRAGEQVRSVQALGTVGAVVTSDRMLAISADAFEWQSIQLQAKEVAAEAYLSEALVLFVTHERILSFDGTLNRFVIESLPVGENVVDQRVEFEAAAAVTLRRVFGYAAGSAKFSDFSFRAGETFRELEASGGWITVTTSSRILLFQAHAGDWEEQALPVEKRW